MVDWKDHHKAAFYPPVDVPRHTQPPFSFKKKEIIKFALDFLENSAEMLIDTEHF